MTKVIKIINAPKKLLCFFYKIDFWGLVYLFENENIALKLEVFTYLYDTKKLPACIADSPFVVCGYMDLSIRLCCEAVFAALLKPLYGS